MHDAGGSDRTFELDRAYAILTTDHDDEAPTDRLYRLWYHQQSGHEERFPQGTGYHAASLHLSRFERGWRVVEEVRGALAPAWTVIRDGHTRTVSCPDLVPETLLAQGPADRRALGFEPDMAVAVNPLSSAATGGFWNLHSPRWEREGPACPRVRLYFAVRERCELAFVRRYAGAAALDARWAMKILCGPGPAGRRDTAVAYVPADTPLQSGWLADLLDDLGGFVGGKAPPGAVAIRPGISWAPEVSQTKSFGQVLCDTLVDLSADRGLLLERGRWMRAASSRLERVVNGSAAA